MPSYVLKTYILHTVVYKDGEIYAILPPANDVNGWDQWAEIAYEMFR